MKDINSLEYSKWIFGYYIVFAPNIGHKKYMVRYMKNINNVVKGNGFK
ncbi:MAG: hypothetical protein IAC55_06200 [Tyzzerella sp.]|uniref:Uncharacterized protein n=1 Tax=Candidatus Fimicola merdigallinarum TaxID=2840819 RepID=A0A9D9DXV3_9FIRM|nr:hypothetical protein [Candidatus Fimicola merdigallinarum]